MGIIRGYFFFDDCNTIYSILTHTFTPLFKIFFHLMQITFYNELLATCSFFIFYYIIFIQVNIDICNFILFTVRVYAVLVIVFFHLEPSSLN